MRRSTALCGLVAWAVFPLVGHADDGLRKGPWLMDLRETSVVVMAERGREGTLHVSAHALGPAMSPGAEAGSDVTAAVVAESDRVEADASAPATLHEITLSGLRPGTRYAYEVTGPGVDATGGSFTTPPTSAVPFRFVIYGDTRSGDRAHRAVIEAIDRDGPDFAVHTGDLVADGRDEDDWRDFFRVAAPMLRNVPFVPVIGNHEFQSPGSSGADNFRRYVHFEPTGPSPELDAVFRFANTRFILASSYDDWTGPSRDWLTSELQRARREDPDGWLFVVMHEGPRSSGPHGDSDLMRDAGIDRLMRRMRVDLVIAGHDHGYERGDDEGLRYMVSGGGGAPLYPRRQVRSHTRVFASEHHFVRVDIDRDKAVFTALRPDGTSFDHAVLRHAGWEDMRRDTAPPARAPDAPPEPAGPDIDWETLVKFAPLLVLVSLGAWWARRRAMRG